MRHRVAISKLGKRPAHRRAMLRNMVTSLLRHERIRTTAPKAKEARRHAEHMITLGKRGDLHARRQAARFINDETVLKKLFDEIAGRFKERRGGYTRILRTGPRLGDASEMAILELITQSPERQKPKNRKTRERLKEFHVGDQGGKSKRKGARKSKPAEVGAAGGDADGDEAADAVAEPVP